MKKIKDLNKGLDGIDFLRGLVNNYGWRDEHLNGEKTPIQLINEYLKYVNGVTDLDGNKI
tara:strand:+ start:21 stop:200 length:180 start_codon:yes stop_codon:yes gene_type:complete